MNQRILISYHINMFYNEIPTRYKENFIIYNLRDMNKNNSSACGKMTPTLLLFGNPTIKIPWPVATMKRMKHQLFFYKQTWFSLQTYNYNNNDKIKYLLKNFRSEALLKFIFDSKNFSTSRY